MEEFETHYHGTTVDKLDGIAEKSTIPMHRLDTGFTGAWTTKRLEKSIKHAIERGQERGGTEPVVLEYILSKKWVKENNDRSAVNAMKYDENVHCFKAPLPKEHLQRLIYPNRK